MSAINFHRLSFSERLRLAVESSRVPSIYNQNGAAVSESMILKIHCSEITVALITGEAVPRTVVLEHKTLCGWCRR